MDTRVVVYACGIFMYIIWNAALNQKWREASNYKNIYEIYSQSAENLYAHLV